MKTTPSFSTLFIFLLVTFSSCKNNQQVLLPAPAPEKQITLDFNSEPCWPYDFAGENVDSFSPSYGPIPPKPADMNKQHFSRTGYIGFGTFTLSQLRMLSEVSDSSITFGEFVQQINKKADAIVLRSQIINYLIANQYDPEVKSYLNSYEGVHLYSIGDMFYVPQKGHICWMMYQKNKRWCMATTKLSEMRLDKNNLVICLTNKR